jgi:lambda repressor-like predicted transcriptional regulator
MTSFADDDVMEYRSPLESRVSHAEIEALGRQGLSVVSISKQTGVARFPIERVLLKAGIKQCDDILSRSPTAPHKFYHKVAVEAVRRGESLASVARRMGVTPGAVAYVVRRASETEEVS